MPSPRLQPVLTTILGLALIVLVTTCPSSAQEKSAPGAKPAAVPAAVAPKLEAFRKVAWGDLLKPARAEPAPASWRTRCEAEWALAGLAAADAPAVLPLLADEDRFVRALAARAAGIAQPPGAAKALVEALAKEKDRIARIALVEAIGRTGGDGALEAVEAQQVPGADPDLVWTVGLARRQLKGGRWDVESIRGEHAEAARRAEFAVATPGKPAPEIALPGPSGVVNLSTLKGRIVLLVFAHGDRGGADAKAIQRLTMEQAKLDEWKVAVVIVDPHEKERTKAWADRLRLPFTFASDPAGRAAAAYGVARQLFAGGEWLPSPSWCIVDKEGKLAWRKTGTKMDEHASLGDLVPVLTDVSRGIRVW